jgi:hypothetical protein
MAWYLDRLWRGLRNSGNRTWLSGMITFVRRSRSQMHESVFDGMPEQEAVSEFSGPNLATTGNSNPNYVDCTYDAFISYRRAQGWRVASWLSTKLERYRPSKELLMQLPPALRERLQKPRRVFLDIR